MSDKFSVLRSGRALAVIAGVIVFISLCAHLGELPLMADEGRNAEIAREMKVSGAWLVPTYNGADFLDKPAFYFRAVALSLSAFGDNETAARLPSAVFAVILIAMVFAFCRRVYGTTRVAWLATIVVATMPLYFALSRIVIFDMVLACFVCGAIFAGFLAEETEGSKRRNWYLLGAVSTGLATLVKGPVGFLIPLLVHVAFQLLAGRRGIWKRTFAPINLLTFFALTLPWFIGLCLVKRDFLHYGLVEESFNRFTNAQTFQRGKPFYYFLLLVAGTFFPWSVLLPSAMVSTWKLRRSIHRADLLALVWSVLVVVFFSISQSKQPVYILSVTVACGILLARLFDDAMTNPASQAARLLRRATLSLVLVSMALLGIVLWGLIQPDRVAAILKISTEGVHRMRDSSWPLASFFGVFALFGAVGIYRRSVAHCFFSLALFWPVFLLVNLSGIEQTLAHRSDQAMAEGLRSLPKGTKIVSLQCYPSTLSFYLGQTLTLATTDGNELTSKYIRSCLARPTPWPATIVRVSELDHWLAQRTGPVYIVGRANDTERLKAFAAPTGATVQSLNRNYAGVLLPAPASP